MPRDITHWMVAEKVAESLPAGTFQNACRDNHHWLLLGSVLHDAFFYLPEKSPLNRFKKIADRFHGNYENDSLDAIVGLAEAIRKKPESPKLKALLVGLCSHMMTDATFHPLVYYHTELPDPVTEQLSHSGLRAHYRMEAAIDLYFCNGRSHLSKWSLNKFWTSALPEKDSIFAEIGGILLDQSEIPDFVSALTQSFKRFAFAQNVFKNAFAAIFFKLLKPFLSESLKDSIALFYSPGLIRKLKGIVGPLSYLNPVTGEEYSETLDQLFTRSIQKSVDLINKLTKDETVGDIERPGPILDTGISGAGIKAMKYSSGKHLI